MENKNSDQYSVAFSVFWLTSSIFTALALYDYMLRPYVSTLDNGLVPHTVGPTGFELAQLIVGFFGYGAFAWPPFLFFLCVMPFLKDQLNRARIVNLLVIYLLSVALLNLTVPIHTQDPVFSAGGALGKTINDFIFRYVDYSGSCLLLGAALLVCLEYQFRALWRRLFTYIQAMLVTFIKILTVLRQQTFDALYKDVGYKPAVEPVLQADHSNKVALRGRQNKENRMFINSNQNADKMNKDVAAPRQSPKLPSMGTAAAAVTVGLGEAKKSPIVASITRKKSIHEAQTHGTIAPTNQAHAEQRKDNKSDAVPKRATKVEPTAAANAKASSSTQEPAEALMLSPPPLDLLNQDKLSEKIKEDPQKLQLLAQAIEDKLKDFGVKAKVMNILLGPIITRFEIQPAPGTKASKVTGLARDLARSLSVTSVRVVEVIAGKTYIGLEIPNKNRVTVSLKTLFESHAFQSSKSALCLALGVDISGDPVVVDLAKMPHMLVAGTTGSGKSVGLNTMLLSLLYKTSPQDLKLILIDPKMLEFAVYEGIPHLLTSVVTDMNDASFALNWCVNEMERRYKLMAELGVRNISSYNSKVKQMPDIETTQSHLNSGEPEYHTHLPYIVVIADEFADMMMMVGKKVETLIARLAQKARAAGIHLILATQRPSVDVITGLIKANIPTRISFQVSSKIDSRTILDQQGAESLLGSGDMLYLSPGSGLPIRCHGAYVSDEAIAGVVKHLRSLGKPDYIELHKPDGADSPQIDMLISDEKKNKDDALYDQIIDFVTTSRKVSTSSVQRRFRIGYNRAAVMVDRLEQEGVISAMDTNGQRQVLAPPPSKHD